MKRSDILMAATALTLVLTAAVPMSASAAGFRGGEKMTFEELDKDADGKITAADIEAMRNEAFAALDSNSDGNVSLEEFQASAAAKASERAATAFERLDADGDGVVSRDAIEARGPKMSDRMLERLDKDNDGGISAEEFAQAKERMGRHRDGDRRGGHWGSHDND